MNKSVQHFDIALIGAGIAGASVASSLAGQRSVILLERESQPGYHTTGRSAAVYAPFYGPRPVRALTRAAHAFFNNPPDGFSNYPLLKPLDAMFLAREDQLSKLEAMQSELAVVDSVRRIGSDELEARIPILRKGYAVGALLDTATSEIDVAALHQGFLRLFRWQGGILQTHSEVKALQRRKGYWEIETSQCVFNAPIVVNASGAWADVIGQMAGAEEIGLKPLRRTALMIDPPAGFVPEGLPLMIDIEEQFYLKPDAGKLLISPANEDLDVPCDVQPDELDIAICVDRIERAFEIDVQRIDSSWAGLRSFVSDKTPVAGFSKQVEGFYWLAGQEGYGIQTSPTLADYAAAEIMGQPFPQYILDEGLEPVELMSGRL